MICVYKITSPSGRIYVGQTTDWVRRVNEYRNKLAINQPKLNRSFLKYGYKNHSFEVIRVCEPSELNLTECYYIDLYDSINNGLNSKGGGSGGFMPLDIREKISRAHTGKIVKQSTKDKLSEYRGRKHHMFGKKHPQHVKDKMRERAKNRKHTQETRDKLSRIQMGGNSPLSKLVLDTSTGIYYDSPRDAANTFGYNLTTMRCKLNGSLRNNTSLIYC